MKSVGFRLTIRRGRHCVTHKRSDISRVQNIAGSIDIIYTIIAHAMCRNKGPDFSSWLAHNADPLNKICPHHSDAIIVLR
jgi:hypothetical protein